MSLHIKLIMNTVHLFIESALKAEGYQRGKLLEIHSKITGYNVFHKFNQVEHEQLIELGKHEYMEELKAIEVDFGVYGMELLTILIKDVPKSERFMNISDKKIFEYEANRVKDMLNLKGSDRYENVKAVVIDSKLTAQKFYAYTKDEIRKVS